MRMIPKPVNPKGPTIPTVGGGPLVLPPRMPIPKGTGLPIKNPMDDFPFGRRRRGLAGLFGMGRKPMKSRRKGFLGKGISGLLGRLKEKMPMIETMQEEMMMPMRGGMMDVNMKEMRFPRMMMADGLEVDKEDYEASTQSLIDFLNSDPEQVSFGRAVAGMLAYDDGVVQISEQEVRDAIEEYKRTAGEFVKAMNISDSEIRKEVLPKLRNSKEVRLMEGGRYNPSENPNRPEIIEGYAEGGEASFPDLTGDNKVTQADILKGRGVFAEGDEVSMMMMEMEGDEDGMQEEAIKELEAARPEFEMMQQLAQVVINLLEQGASEAEIVAILKEQGLDEEDIQTLLEYVNEMMGQAEQVEMAEEDIGSQLAALG